VKERLIADGKNTGLVNAFVKLMNPDLTRMR
jgi:hypothetical protein